jgi:hypothetical protein
VAASPLQVSYAEICVLLRINFCVGFLSHPRNLLNAVISWEIIIVQNFRLPKWSGTLADAEVLLQLQCWMMAANLLLLIVQVWLMPASLTTKVLCNGFLCWLMAIDFITNDLCNDLGRDVMMHLSLDLLQVGLWVEKEGLNLLGPLCLMAVSSRYKCSYLGSLVK